MSSFTIVSFFIILPYAELTYCTAAPLSSGMSVDVIAEQAHIFLNLDRNVVLDIFELW